MKKWIVSNTETHKQASIQQNKGANNWCKMGEYWILLEKKEMQKWEWWSTHSKKQHRHGCCTKTSLYLLSMPQSTRNHSIYTKLTILKMQCRPPQGNIKYQPLTSQPSGQLLLFCLKKKHLGLFHKPSCCYLLLLTKSGSHLQCMAWPGGYRTHRGNTQWGGG